MEEQLLIYPRVFAISGPSGVGKSSLIQRAREQVTNMELSVSLTTRPKRRGEVDGIDYHFVAEASFQEMLAQKKLLEHTTVYGNYYGTLANTIQQMLDNKDHVVLDLDTKGVLNLKEIYQGFVTIFISPPDLSELEHRLRNRRTETSQSLEKRMNGARNEMAQIEHYDYLVINSSIQEAVSRLVEIINTEIVLDIPFLQIEQDK